MTTVLCALLAALQALPTMTPEAHVWMPDGRVEALAYDDGLLYVGGRFHWLGPATGPFALLATDTGAVSAGKTRLNGVVFDAEPDGTGGWFLGGKFVVDQSACENLVHVLADGTLDAWCAGVSGQVWSIARYDGKLFIGGLFEEVGGLVRQRMAALDAATGQVLPWDPAVAATMQTGEVVRCLEAAGGIVVLGGRFHDPIGGVLRTNAAAVDAVTGLATAFNPEPDGEVMALELAESKVYLGGGFTTVGGKPRPYMAEVSLAGGIPTELNPQPDGYVSAFALAGDLLYVGGHFETLGNAPRRGLAAIDVLSGYALPWAPALQGVTYDWVDVFGLAVGGGMVYAAGWFDEVNGVPRRNVAQMHAETGAVTAWTADCAGEGHLALCAVLDGAKLGVGGEFTFMGAVPREGAAAIDLATGKPTPWSPAVLNEDGPEPMGLVNDFAFDDGRVYLLGNFTSVNGVEVHDVVAVDKVGGSLVPGFVAGATGSKGYVDLGLLSGDSLKIMGFLNPVPELIADLDASTGAVSPGFDLHPGGLIHSLSLEPPGGPLYLGGDFLYLEDAQGTHVREHIAAVDPASGMVLPFDPSASATIRAMARRGDLLFVGGGFDTISGQPLEHLAALDAASGALQAWSADLKMTSGLGVSLLASHLDVLFAGGGFKTGGPTGAQNLAALDARTGDALDWSPALIDAPDALLLAGGRLFVGGNFAEFDDHPAWNLVSLPIQYLQGDVASISVAAGGSQQLDLKSGSELAGMAYLIAGSLSGSAPGFDLQGYHVPLNPDPYLLLTLNLGAAPLSGSFGILDAVGSATAAFSLPAGSNPSFAGLTLQHAAALFDPATFELALVSNPVPLQLLP
jgi:trimeric autotransporter adhesin